MPVDNASDRVGVGGRGLGGRSDGAGEHDRLEVGGLHSCVGSCVEFGRRRLDIFGRDAKVLTSLLSLTKKMSVTVI